MSETGQAKTALENILHDNFVSDKITLSVVGIGITQNDAASMQDLIDAAGGQQSGVEGGRKVLAYTDNKLETLPRDLREELNVPQIKSVNDGEPFYITAYDKTSNIVKGVSYITENQTVKDPVTGKDVLRYGGDFDDKPADYEFSANGIVFADRKEKPAMQEVRYYYGLYR